MKFYATLDTMIYEVPYAQGQEIDVTGWQRSQMLQMLSLGMMASQVVESDGGLIDLETGGVRWLSGCIDDTPFITVAYSVWGISEGVPYYDDEGALEAERAIPVFSSTDSSVNLVIPEGST